MTGATEVVKPECLFERAGLAAAGSVAWKEEVPERGSGVYVITASEPPSDEQLVVYIGRSKNLCRRLSQFYKHRYGQSAPHRGGQEILTLSGKLTVYWCAVADYPGAEKAMMEAFHGVAGVWPFGNRMKSAVATAVPQQHLPDR
jgi:hypothetical protein